MPLQYIGAALVMHHGSGAIIGHKWITQEGVLPLTWTASVKHFYLATATYVCRLFLPGSADLFAAKYEERNDWAFAPGGHTVAEFCFFMLKNFKAFCGNIA